MRLVFLVKKPIFYKIILTRIRLGKCPEIKTFPWVIRNGVLHRWFLKDRIEYLVPCYRYKNMFLLILYLTFY